MRETAGLVTIGEFSRLSCISSRMLRYYDRLGVLRPMITDELSGYRWYSLRQLDHAARVARLRDLNVPTALMVDLVRLDPTSDEFGRALADHRRQLVSQGRQIARQVAELDAWMARIEQAPELTARRTTQAERRVAFARGVVATYRDTSSLWDAVLAYAAVDLAAPPAGFVSGSVCHDEEYRESRCDLEMWVAWDNCPGYDLVTTSFGVAVGARSIPAQDVVEVTFAGNYIGNDAIYEAIGREMLAQHLNICGPTHHLYHPGPPLIANPDSWVTDVAIPVSGPDRPAG